VRGDLFEITSGTGEQKHARARRGERTGHGTTDAA
jgi:hypothetical protein